MILQALKNMYPKASEKVLRAVIKDLESAVLDRETRDSTHHSRSIKNKHRGRFKAESGRR